MVATGKWARCRHRGVVLESDFLFHLVNGWVGGSVGGTALMSRPSYSGSNAIVAGLFWGGFCTLSRK